MALFLYSFNTVAPLILVVAVGFLLKKLRMVDDAFISKANKVCFQVAFPLQLFHNIYAADFDAEFRPSSSYLPCSAFWQRRFCFA